ncbi:unnamed protein product [Pleuronectes platessa]|uniref:Uncharacterized protein n=1 Tax=Pleuronectes platessa TaxID=8262 RepID=A0A9N7VHM7_PLEPL|nr:unnamed protein product [Pleuronectes platessa]
MIKIVGVKRSTQSIRSCINEQHRLEVEWEEAANHRCSSYADMCQQSSVREACSTVCPPTPEGDGRKECRNRGRERAVPVPPSARTRLLTVKHTVDSRAGGGSGLIVMDDVTGDGP